MEIGLPRGARTVISRARSICRAEMHRKPLTINVRDLFGESGQRIFGVNAPMVLVFGAVRVAWRRRRVLACRPSLRRASPRGGPLKASLADGSAPADQPHPRVCRSQRSTLALCGEALFVREARQHHRNRLTIDDKRPAFLFVTCQRHW